MCYRQSYIKYVLSEKNFVNDVINYISLYWFEAKFIKSLHSFSKKNLNK